MVFRLFIKRTSNKLTSFALQTLFLPLRFTAQRVSDTEGVLSCYTETSVMRTHRICIGLHVAYVNP